MEVADAASPDVLSNLTDSFEKRKDFDVADRSPDFRDHHVDVVGGEGEDPALDLIRHVGNDLNGFSQVVAAALFRQDGLVNRTRGGIAVSRKVNVNESLVVPEVKVSFAAVGGNEHLTVFERVHGARVNVQVRIELLHGDPKSPLLQEPTQRCRGDPLSQRTRHAARHEDVLSHGITA